VNSIVGRDDLVGEGEAGVSLDAPHFQKPTADDFLVFFSHDYSLGWGDPGGAALHLRLYAVACCAGLSRFDPPAIAGSTDFFRDWQIVGASRWPSRANRASREGFIYRPPR
jgi:hypothetical protein